MELSKITPLILTYNEEANIADTLDRLRWADRIVVVDSFSTDSTLEILKRFPNVKVYQRKFDHFADQCNWAFPLIETDWLLSIDADYKIPTQFVQEVAELDGKLDGYFANFQYGVFGKPLRACLYPGRCILFRKSKGSYRRDGHAHRVEVQGTLGRLKSKVMHDDHKPIHQWFKAQRNYAVLEADKLQTKNKWSLSIQDRLRRKYFIAPVLIFFYCLFYKRLILDGWRGVYYTMQRVYAELILGMELLDRRLRGLGPSSNAESEQSSFPKPDRQQGAAKRAGSAAVMSPDHSNPAGEDSDRLAEAGSRPG